MSLSDVGSLLQYLVHNSKISLNISDQLQQNEDYAQKLNAAFLIFLTGGIHPNYTMARSALFSHNPGKNFRLCSGFYQDAYEKISKELGSLTDKDAEITSAISHAIQSVHAQDPAEVIQEKIWQIFCPEACDIKTDPGNAIRFLRKKRRVSVKELNNAPLTDPGTQILFTSNILLTRPLRNTKDYQDILSPDIIRILSQNESEAQQYWYDHPIPVGIPPEQNEVLYGISGLDAMVEIEKKRGNMPKDTRLTCLLSASVTHASLHQITREYIENELQKYAPIQHLNLFVFTESDTNEIIEQILIPAKDKYINDHNDINIEEIFGVDGEYGRHYSFLKAIAVFWSVMIDPAIRATFKIDLDQVFPQKNLIDETGLSVFEHFRSELWGARGTDADGNPLALDMIAGALVNDKDIENSLFTPDVPYPGPIRSADEQVFFSKLPQAISTQAEMMTRYETGDIDGQKYCLQRVHVTGGTNGILVDALKKYQPFTPTFMGRAEDQAYIMSVLSGHSPRLAYLHKPGLIMRHDKESFAQEAINVAHTGKIIGDYTRIILFSQYARIIDQDIYTIKDILDPFTGCFISRLPVTVVYLRFALKAAEMYTCSNPDQAREFVLNGIDRIPAAIEFSQNMESVVISQKTAWQMYYRILAHLESALNRKDPFALSLQSKAQEIIRKSKILLSPE